MVDPVTIISIGSKIVSGIFGHKKAKAASRARAAAANVERIRNLQSRRKFLREFRQAQAAALVSGAATGGGLDSSLTQGQLASANTQARFGTFEQDVMATYSARADRYANKAARYSAYSDLANLAGGFLDAYPFAKGTASTPTPSTPTVTPNDLSN